MLDILCIIENREPA